MHRLLDELRLLLSCATRRDIAQVILAFIGVLIALIALIAQIAL